MYIDFILRDTCVDVRKSHVPESSQAHELDQALQEGRGDGKQTSNKEKSSLLQANRCITTIHTPFDGHHEL